MFQSPLSRGTTPDAWGEAPQMCIAESFNPL